MSGILSIENYETDLGKKTEQFINDKSYFNNTHISKSKIQPVSNIQEEECFISSMTPIELINGQDESRCYVNWSFQGLFFNIFFIMLIMNIDCEILLTNLENSTDDYNGNLQKIMILQVIQQILCEMLIGGKIVNSDVFFLVTNIRTNVQNGSSDFEGIIHEMVSHKPFSNQEICHIDLNGEKIICTVSTYIKEFLIIVEIENKQCHRCSNMKPHFEVISD